MADAGPCYVCTTPTAPRKVGGSTLMVCGECGLGQLVQSEAQPADQDYWTRGADHDAELTERYWTQSRTSVFRGALDLLEREVGKGRILDIGGGVGHFAACALGAGWDAYSVDVSDVAVAAAAERIGADRSFASIPDELVGTCDAVTLWCVVAHVPDPRAVLADARRALRPGGRMFLTTPNFRFQVGYAAVLARVGQPIDFSGHDHVLHFTADALRRTLASTGLASSRFAYVGITEDCVASRRLAPVAVPAKRAWNQGAAWAARAGLPLLSSELQAVGVAP